MDEKEVAKQIIVEIIRQAGGVLENKTNLFKAFYYAHLRYAEAQQGHLSLWPIIRMPMGPGIAKADKLLLELTAEGILKADTIKKGSRLACRFTVIGDAELSAPLHAEAIEAIRHGVEMVKGKTAAFVSDISHQQSRSWRESANGKPLNIYDDLVSDEEHQERKQGIAGLISAASKAWPSKR